MSRYIEIDTALLKTVTAGRLSAKALWRRIMEQPSIEIDLANDGTLSVEVEDATKVKRVLVEDGKNGDLYYGDIYYVGRPQGEWIEHWYPHFNVAGIKCSICSKDIPYWERNYDMPNYCPNCGAHMKGTSK